MQGLACVIGQQKRSATSLALLSFFHTAPAMSIRFSRHVRSRTPSGHVGRPGQGQGKVSCPCRTTDWYHFSFFFCALTLLSAAQGKHEWTAMKSTGSCFSQKKALRHPLRLLQKPQAVNGKARGKLTHNGNGGPNGLCPGLPDSDRLRRAGSCQACRPDRDTPIP